MNRWYLAITFLIPHLVGFAQWRSASLNGQGQVEWESVEVQKEIPNALARSKIMVSLMPGYPKAFRADPFFKNFRNVTLADLDNDGVDEIIIGSANMLFVLKDSTVWWSKKLSGLMRFPAAVGDLDLDSKKELIICTGYNREPGHIYVLNADGSDREGWPLSFDGRWMLSSPALADIDQDGFLEIICSDLESSWGHVYILEADGSLSNEEWPIILPNIPAVTPSIGDIDGDGEPEIVISSTREIYAFDQNAGIKAGWPFGNGLTKFSFQSPILYDIDRDGKSEIIGEGHGDQPEFFILNGEGQYVTNWQKAVPDQRWTFHTPTVINHDGSDYIFTARPISNGASDMLYAWTGEGTSAPGFPISKEGGLEGLVTVADVDDDLEPEILFSSNLYDSLGFGFIHAYELDGSGDIAGFPLRPRGLTFLNGATIGDVDGDKQMDLVVLSYTEHPGSDSDTTFLSVYNLNVPISVERLWWPTYKGNNLRNGDIEAPKTTSSSAFGSPMLTCHPNPAEDKLLLELPLGQWRIQLISLDGKICQDVTPAPGVHVHAMQVENLLKGIYFLRAISRSGEDAITHKVILQ